MSEFKQGDIFEILTSKRPTWRAVHEIDKGDVSFVHVDRLSRLRNKVANGDYAEEDLIQVGEHPAEFYRRSDFPEGFVAAQTLRDEIADNGWSQFSNGVFIVPADHVKAFEHKFKAIVGRLHKAHPTSDPWGVGRRSSSHFRVVRDKTLVLWSTASAAPRHDSVVDEHLVSGGITISQR